MTEYQRNILIPAIKFIFEKYKDKSYMDRMNLFSQYTFLPLYQCGLVYREVYGITKENEDFLTMIAKFYLLEHTPIIL